MCSLGHASPLSIDFWLENSIYCNSSRAVVEKHAQVCGRKILGRMLNTETAHTQETAELQTPGDSAAVSALKKQHLYLFCISTLP